MNYVKTLPLMLFLVNVVTTASANELPPFELRSTVYFVYPVTQGESVQIDVHPRISSAYASALPGFRVIDQDSRTVVSKRAFGEKIKIQYRAAASGINALVLEARRHWCQVDFADRPSMICAKPEQPIHFRKTPGPLYFFVPPRADRVEFDFCCPDKREGGTFRVRTPDGSVVTEQTDWFHEPTRIRIATQEAHRGRAWALETDDPKQHGAAYAIDDVLVYFTAGALPFVSRSADDLLEVLLAADE